MLQHNKFKFNINLLILWKYVTAFCSGNRSSILTGNKFTKKPETTD